MLYLVEFKMYKFCWVFEGLVFGGCSFYMLGEGNVHNAHTGGFFFSPLTSAFYSSCILSVCCQLLEAGGWWVFKSGFWFFVF